MNLGAFLHSGLPALWGLPASGLRLGGPLGPGRVALSRLGLCFDLPQSGEHSSSGAPPEALEVPSEDFRIVIGIQGSIADDLCRVPIEVGRFGFCGDLAPFSHNGSVVRLFDAKPLEAIASMVGNNFKAIFSHRSFYTNYSRLELRPNVRRLVSPLVRGLNGAQGIGTEPRKALMLRSKVPQVKVSAEKRETSLLDLGQIRSMVFTRQRVLRRNWPSKWSSNRRDLTLRRAYYVWRWARFHGGADTRLPLTASHICDDDPELDVLDELANRIALEVFGTNMAGANRWREILTGKKTPKSPIPFAFHVMPGNSNGNPRSLGPKKRFVC